MISKVVEWFADLFGSIWSAIVSVFKWLVETIYNAFIDFVEAIFARMVDLFIFVLSYFPDFDLSEYANGFDALVSYYSGFDELLPLTELFVCASLYLTFCGVYAIVRLIIKLIPTIG